jgi:uncharacterized membrane protein
MYGETKFFEFVKHLIKTIEEQYYCKIFSKEMITINVTTSESYRKLKCTNWNKVPTNCLGLYRL